MDSLLNEKHNLKTFCEKLQKDLEEIKRENEKVKAKDQEVQTDFPISHHEESPTTSAETFTSDRGRDPHLQRHETHDIPESSPENINS